MDKRKKSGHSNGKNCHGLGTSSNGCAPVCPEQEKNGRDQGTRVGDSNPKDEIHQVGAPVHWMHDTRRTETRQNLIGPTGGPQQDTSKGDPDQKEIGSARRGQRPEHLLINVAVGIGLHRLCLSQTLGNPLQINDRRFRI